MVTRQQLAERRKEHKMSDNLTSMDGLDDILALVHEELEGGASGDRVKAIAEANPQARDEILAFAEAWFASDGSDLSDDTLGIAQTVSKHDTLLDLFWKLSDAGSDQSGPRSQARPAQERSPRMVTRQMHADACLQHWQDLRARFPDPEERIEQLMFEFFRDPMASAVEYDATLRRVSEEMSDAS